MSQQKEMERGLCVRVVFVGTGITESIPKSCLVNRIGFPTAKRARLGRGTVFAFHHAQNGEALSEFTKRIFKNITSTTHSLADGRRRSGYDVAA